MKLVHFPGANLRDMPDMLRRLAKDIENGVCGQVNGIALVTHCAPDKGEHRIDVYGFGETDIDRAVVLLGAGKDLLTDCILGRD